MRTACSGTSTCTARTDVSAPSALILPVQADEVLDGSHLLCYPGLINTHHHLYQQFSRNLPEVQNLELFPWLKALYEI